MSLRQKVRMTFGAILVLAILAGLVDYPKGPDLRLGKFTKELKVHLGLDLQGGAHLVYEADVSKIPTTDRASALEGTRDVIERRVNAFGVSEPIVQTNTVGESNRVIVELPGVTDVNDAISRIGKTPLLEFREEKAPEPLTEEQKEQFESTNAAALKRAQDIQAEVNAGKDFASLADQFSDDPGNAASDDGTKKGGDLGFQDLSVYVAEFKEAVEKLKDGEATKEAIQSPFGYHIIKREETREAQNTNGSPTQEVRVRHILFRTLSESDLNGGEEQFANTGLSGQHLKRAEVTFDQTSGAPEVSLTFNDEGKKLFGDITKRNVSKPVAIYLDDVLISSPVVQQEITTGNAVINGSFDLQEAKTLAANLNAGALPVPIRLVSQQTIEASLGQAAVEKSFVAGVIGLLLVAFFMIAYYRFPGMLAVCALVVYTLVVLAIFKLWPVTLTLAGIAGFILSIGMAVDANVLIFERTKEELRLGKPLPVAIEQGFSRAWLSIRDSNASSIITCVILAWFGTSLIKGFAITLGIGIFVSMFSAITVTRTFLRLLMGEWLTRHHWLFGVRRNDVSKEANHV